MVTKNVALKRQLIKEAAICVVVVIALCGGGMAVSNYDDDTQSEKRLKENENTTIRSEHDSIEQRLGTGVEVNAFYDVYVKNHSSDLLLKRDAATQWLSALREKNHLANLSVSIDPLTDTTLEFGQLRSGTAVKSEIHLSFGAITDNSAYGFIESLQRNMPGILIVKDIKLSRSGDLTRNILVDLSQHKISPVINGDISFTWVGIRPAEEKAASPPANGAR